MKDQRKTEIKVGIMVILGLLIFLWILGWAKNFSFRDTDRILSVKFPNVAGLEIGDYVTVNGVRKGIVEDFSVESTGVLVKLTLDREVVLKKDATFAVSMLDLMGGKKVEIIPGNDPEELNYNQVQQGIYYADIPAVMSMLGTVQEDLFSALTEVNTTLTGINKYLTDDTVHNEVRTSLKNISEITSRLNSILESNREQFEVLLNNTVVLTNNANEIIEENRHQVSSAVKSLQSVLVRTDSLVYSLNLIAGETARQENNLGKLLYDPALMDTLKSTLSETRAMIKMLTEQLQNDGLKVDADVDLF